MSAIGPNTIKWANVGGVEVSTIRVHPDYPLVRWPETGLFFPNGDSTIFTYLTEEEAIIGHNAIVWALAATRDALNAIPIRTIREDS